jgi:hypothetical protein
VVFLTNAYRHLEKPVEVLSNIVPALKSEGRLGIIESKGYAKDDESNEIIQNAKQAGFTLISMDRSLSRDDIYVFVVRLQKH